ncbi:MAG: hypothetical protein ACHP6H_06420 [Legionellales bacterium]
MLITSQSAMTLVETNENLNHARSVAAKEQSLLRSNELEERRFKIIFSDFNESKHEDPHDHDCKYDTYQRMPC